MSHEKPKLFEKAQNWLFDRFPLRTFLEWAKHKTVPYGRLTIWYYFGGVTLFLFAIQVSTGILLMFYYRPGADTAFESIRFLMANVPFGWLIRSVHSWSANLMVLSLFIHMFSAFFMRAYAKPRELTWLVGILLFGIVLGFGFSGYLLPWNELAFFATKVGTDMMGVIPVVGHTMMKFLRGGEEVTGATLNRFFTLHVAVLPAIFTSLIGIHLLFVQVQGMHEPPEWKEKPEKKRTIPFFPHFFLRDVLLWLVVLDILAILAVFFPWDLGKKADAFSPAPAGIRPEWYFLYMFQTLKILPPKIMGIDGELLGLAAFGLIGLIFLLVPWIDTGKRPWITKAMRNFGIAFIVYMIVMSYFGWTT